MERFDRRQYRLLVKLLRDLGDRREVTSQFGLDRAALGQSAIWFFLFGALLGLAAAGRPPTPHGFLMTAIGLTVFLLIPMLVSNAADAFMNPAEASVLAHQPIRSSTYIAAKATYLFNAAIYLVVPFNLVPAFAGLALRETRAFYPLTHMFAAIAAGLFTVLVMCGVFGLLFRIVPLTRLRNAAMWMQLVVGLVFLVPRLLPVLSIRPNLAAPYWSAVPVSWFASLGLAGQPGRHALAWSWAGPSMLASAVLVVYGVRALTQNYMTRVVLLLRARKARASRRRPGFMGTIVRAVSGGPSGRAAFAFLARMAARDWQFRRVFFRVAVPVILIPILNVGRAGALASPVGGAQLPAIHFLPHMLGMLMLSVCGFIVYSDHYQAAWVFLMAPMAGIRAFVRGIYAGLWMIFVAVPHLIVLLVGTALWGPAAALLFAVYSLALASLYLSVMVRVVNGLPFGSPPRTGRAEGALPVTIAFLLVAAILVAVQRYLLFPFPLRVVAATLVCGVLAVLLARVSLEAVEANVLRNLSVIAAGPSRMFKGTDGD